LLKSENNCFRIWFVFTIYRIFVADKNKKTNIMKNLTTNQTIKIGNIYTDLEGHKIKFTNKKNGKLIAKFLFTWSIKWEYGGSDTEENWKNLLTECKHILD
jgi:hypothetical protein